MSFHWSKKWGGLATLSDPPPPEVYIISFFLLPTPPPPYDGNKNFPADPSIGQLLAENEKW